MKNLLEPTQQLYIEKTNLGKTLRSTELSQNAVWKRSSQVNPKGLDHDGKDYTDRDFSIVLLRS